jgi:hypothetical protein
VGSPRGRDPTSRTVPRSAPTEPRDIGTTRRRQGSSGPTAIGRESPPIGLDHGDHRDRQHPDAEEREGHQFCRRRDAGPQIGRILCDRECDDHDSMVLAVS